VTHLNPAVGKECPFCGIDETVDHLFLYCVRLGSLFIVLKSLFEGFDEVFSYQYFISGPKYTFHDRRKICIFNFLLGMAKIAIWKTQKNKLLGISTVDAENAFKGMVTARIKI